MSIDERIKLAGDALVAAAPAGSQVVLFGSHAQGAGTEDSDLDFLVIEEHVSSKLDEMVRLRDAILPLSIPVDVLVVSAADAEGRRNVPGTLVHRALSEGRALIGA